MGNLQLPNTTNGGKDLSITNYWDNNFNELSNVQKITSAEIGSNFSLESFMHHPHPVRGDIR